MKKIAIWKIIVLNIFTAGLYSIFWYARNRNYFVSKKNEYIPKWTWLIAIPVVYGAGCIVGFTYLVTAVLNNVDIDSTIHSYNMAIFIGCLVALGIYLSWLWFFAGAFEKESQGRVPRWVSLVLGVFIGVFLTAVYQFYINKRNAEKNSNHGALSSGLLIFTSLFTLFGFFSITSTVASLSNSNESIKRELLKTRESFGKVQQLNVEYTKCTQKLAADFPGELTDENKDAYNVANDTCRKIYDDYQKSLETYLNGER